MVLIKLIVKIVKLLYIEQTGRNVISQEIINITEAGNIMKSDSLFANHILDSSHKFDSEVSFITGLIQEKSVYKFNDPDILEINKAIKLNKSLVNSRVNFNSSLLSGL